MAQSLFDAGLDYLSISVDGATQKSYETFRKGGSLKKVLTNIKHAVSLQRSTHIELQFIIMQHNEHEIDKIKQIAKSLGVDALRLKSVLIKKEEWSYLIPSQKHNRYAQKPNFPTCMKPLCELVINADGTVIPCCYVVQDDVKQFALGNAFTHTLSDILQDAPYKTFIAHTCKDKDSNTCCQGCQEGNMDLNVALIPKAFIK
jgi:radical SAM protein with 4Fe4S-binding SPASM domain